MDDAQAIYKIVSRYVSSYPDVYLTIETNYSIGQRELVLSFGRKRYPLFRQAPIPRQQLNEEALQLLDELLRCLNSPNTFVEWKSEWGLGYPNDQLRAEFDYEKTIKLLFSLALQENLDTFIFLLFRLLNH